MNSGKPSLVAETYRIAHFEILLVSVLLYALGGGIAVYLGDSIRWGIYWAGQLAIWMLLLSSFFLREFFSLPVVPPDRRSEQAPVFSRNNLLVISATALTAGAALTVLLLADGALNLPDFVFLGLAVLLSLAYAMPPLRLAYSGYGELVFSILMANLIPAIGFLLQSGELHRFLALLTFPLTFLYLAASLALQLQRYAEDVRRERRTMLTRLGWQRGMNLHNLLVLVGFLLLGSAALLGLPWRLTWPGLLGLILGAFEIIQMLSISNGGKPRWGLLRITAAATFVLTVYFITFALWVG